MPQTHVFTHFMIAWNTVHWELQCVPSFCHSSDSELLSEYQKHFWSCTRCHIRAMQSDVAPNLEANPTGLYAFAAKLTRVTAIFASRGNTPTPPTENTPAWNQFRHNKSDLANDTNDTKSLCQCCDHSWGERKKPTVEHSCFYQLLF